MSMTGSQVGPLLEQIAGPVPDIVPPSEYLIDDVEGAPRNL